MQVKCRPPARRHTPLVPTGKVGSDAGIGSRRPGRGADPQEVPMDDRSSALRALSARRTRIATALTLLMVVIYFGFIALVAFGKQFLGELLTPGLSIGILLGALVIVSAWLLTYIYVRWANRVYDPAIETMRR
jgi:uncharacterized membrane protein (DUF485 family)